MGSATAHGLPCASDSAWPRAPPPPQNPLGGADSHRQPDGVQSASCPPPEAKPHGRSAGQLRGTLARLCANAGAAGKVHRVQRKDQVRLYAVVGSHLPTPHAKHLLAPTQSGLPHKAGFHTKPDRSLIRLQLSLTLCAILSASGARDMKT
eukprot:366328-Chlamydomonas_euryale.AAC.2